MVKFILKRIGTMIIAMFMIILITFTLMHSIPGGPFTNTKGVPEEVTQAMEAKYGLDQPMPVQFVKYLGNLLHGDFGPSYKYTGKTVNDFIATGAPVSAKLGLVTLVFVLLRILLFYYIRTPYSGQMRYRPLRASRAKKYRQLS